MKVTKITHNADPKPIAKRGRPKGSKNKVNKFPVYAYRCKKCNHRFEINIKTFYHTCSKCQSACDCITTEGKLK